VEFLLTRLCDKANLYQHKHNNSSISNRDTRSYLLPTARGTPEVQSQYQELQVVYLVISHLDQVSGKILSSELSFLQSSSTDKTNRKLGNALRLSSKPS
jgi:hypothetical protein